MPTRLWLPSSGAAPILTVPFDASWNITTGAARLALYGAPIDTSMATKDVSESVTTNPYTALGTQYVSAAIPANITISGTASACIVHRSPTWSSATVNPRVVVKVVTPAGAVRGVLATIQSTAGSSYPSLRGREFSGAVTPVNAIAGDRIVFELGAGFSNTTATTSQLTICVGDKVHIPDAVEGVSTASFDYRSWVELSQEDIWGPVPRKVAGSIVEMAAVADDPIPVRLSGANVEVAAVADDPIPVQVAGANIELLRGRAGQQLRRRLYTKAGATEPLQKFPLLGWRAIRPIPLPEEEPLPPLPLYLGSADGVGSGVSTTGAFPPLKPGDLLLFQFTAGNSFAQQGYGSGPTAIPGVTWVQAYGPTNPATAGQHWVWTGVVTTDDPVIPTNVGIGHTRTDNAVMLSAWRNVSGIFTGSDITRAQAGVDFPSTMYGVGGLTRNRVSITTISGGASTVYTPLEPAAGWFIETAGSTAKFFFCSAPLLAPGVSTNLTLEVTSSSSAVSALLLVLE